VRWDVTVRHLSSKRRRAQSHAGQRCTWGSQLQRAQPTVFALRRTVPIHEARALGLPSNSAVVSGRAAAALPTFCCLPLTSV
jgi:hypothetical protein